MLLGDTAEDAFAELALAGDALADMAGFVCDGFAEMALAVDALADLAFAVWTMAGPRWLLIVRFFAEDAFAVLSWP